MEAPFTRWLSVSVSYPVIIRKCNYAGEKRKFSTNSDSVKTAICTQICVLILSQDGSNIKK